MARIRTLGPVLGASRTRASRRQDWYAMSGNGSAASTKVGTWGILPSVISLETDPTAMAIRMFGFVGGTVDSTGDTVGIGVIAWSYVPGSDAVPAAIPGPVSDGSADWMWWWVAPFVTQVGTSFSFVESDSVINSKARRRLGNDRSLLVVVESVGITANYHYHGRALIKE